jgi:hypothetical protein
MTNEELADELVTRLNALLEAEPGHLPPHVREAVSAVFNHRVAAHKSLGAHPTIVVIDHDDVGVSVSALGVLNGLLGSVGGGGEFAGLVAVETDGMSPLIQRFVRTRA